MLLAFLLGCLGRVQAQTAQQWHDSLSVLNQQISQNPDDMDLRLRKAAVNIELQQWNYAIEEYNYILLHDPQNLVAFYYRAYANTHQRRYDLARNDYEDILRIVPKHMEARLGLCYVLQRLNRNAEAQDNLNLLVEQYPDSASCYVARAMFERAQGAYDVALYDWDCAVRLAPRQVDYLISYVDLLLFLERHDDAKRCLDEAVARGIPRGQLQPWYRKIKK